ncbi:MAG: hypothetical protein R6W91_01535 [Thermoplasmata archaeon]
MDIPTYKYCQLIPSRSALKEMYDLGFDLFMVTEILEEGYDCSRSRRTAGTIERCIDRGGKTLKAVAVQSYNHSLGAEVWVITHVGMFTKRR